MNLMHHRNIPDLHHCGATAACQCSVSNAMPTVQGRKLLKLWVVSAGRSNGSSRAPSARLPGSGCSSASRTSNQPST